MESETEGEYTLLDTEETGGLGEMQILHPAGTFALTPASRIALQTVGRQRHLLHGMGLDWGSGTGCLAIAAARIEGVAHVYGLEISSGNVATARQNATLNSVADRVTFLLADSYIPYAEVERRELDACAGRIDFILANPPSSDDDDGFGFRRLVLEGARRFLVPGGVVFLNISCQYGAERIRRLAEEAPGFSHEGVLCSTEPVPFDLRRPDLLHCLRLYAAEEGRGGPRYSFQHPENPAATFDAVAALVYFRRHGTSPLTRWQTHLFRFAGGE